MDDNSQEVPDNSENSEQLAIIDENVAPKRRGRPAGSKDRAPRRAKTIIVETREPAPEGGLGPCASGTPKSTDALCRGQ